MKRPPRRPDAGARKGERLQKHLAALGLGSRREIEGWISEGTVKVDGRVARLGDRVSADSRITVNGRPVRSRSKTGPARVILYNKPEGEISTRRDPGKRPTIFANLPRLKGQRWIAVGRLDINTRGLLLFTNDGELANRLMHPSSGLEREYHCRVYGEVSDEALEKLTTGIPLDGRPTRFLSVKRARGEGRNTWYSVVVTEGRYREVRRMWQSVGCQLSRLIRVRYGSILLPRGLKAGQWQELKPHQIDRMLKAPGEPKSREERVRRGKKRQ